MGAEMKEKKIATIVDNNIDRIVKETDEYGLVSKIYKKSSNSKTLKRVLGEEYIVR